MMANRERRIAKWLKRLWNWSSQILFGRQREIAASVAPQEAESSGVTSANEGSAGSVSRSTEIEDGERHPGIVLNLRYSRRFRSICPRCGNLGGFKGRLTCRTGRCRPPKNPWLAVSNQRVTSNQ